MKKLHLILLTVIAILSIPVSAFAEETINHTALTSKTILVTFSVNMELERLSGLFNPGIDTVAVGGNFNGWEKATMTVLQSNSDFYHTTVSVLTSVQDTIRFSFCYSPDIWEVVSIREYVVTQTDYDRGSALLDTIGFNSVSLADFPIEVDFRCNMSVQMKEGKFVRGDKVFVRGDFNGWSGIDFELKDVDGDSIYSRIFPNFKRDQLVAFKFTHNHAGNDIWETTNNRTLPVALWGRNIYSAYWEDVSVYVPKKNIQVTFSVNMELERLTGLFNPLTDTVAVGGTFNNWGQTFMTLSSTADIYEVTTPISGVTVGDKFEFKFFYTPNTWENVSNRKHTVTQAEFNAAYIVLEDASFNSSSDDSLPRPQNITFICNTNGASIINANEGTVFESVYIAGRSYPLQWPSNGWSNADSTKMIKLYDDGTHGDAMAGDKIFTIKITFPIYSTLFIKYKYSANWGLTTNGGGNDNELVSDSNHTIQLVNSQVFYVANDTFGIVKYHDFTDVEKFGTLIPSAYKLEQNYPNPFNPGTAISYQLAENSKVNLIIFDVLGNNVATLVNEEQSAGTYQVEFNSKNTEISSGVFFYQLRAREFVQTKKMILLR